MYNPAQPIRKMRKNACETIRGRWRRRSMVPGSFDRRVDSR
jgi:hypothetical protein